MENEESARINNERKKEGVSKEEGKSITIRETHGFRTP
jgi:hypothetical protein